MFALTLPFRLPNFCSTIRATLGQRQIRQSPGLALNAHSGNEWGKIPVLTGYVVCLSACIYVRLPAFLCACLPFYLASLFSVPMYYRACPHIASIDIASKDLLVVPTPSFVLLRLYLPSKTTVRSLTLLLTMLMVRGLPRLWEQTENKLLRPKNAYFNTSEEAAHLLCLRHVFYFLTLSFVLTPAYYFGTTFVIFILTLVLKHKTGASANYYKSIRTIY